MPDLKDYLPSHLQSHICAHDDAEFILRAMGIANASAGDIAARARGWVLRDAEPSLTALSAP